jgi:hypothetical protein
MNLRMLISPFWKRVLIWAGIGGTTIFVDNAAFASTRSLMVGVGVGAGFGAVLHFVSYFFEKRRLAKRNSGIN